MDQATVTEQVVRMNKSNGRATGEMSFLATEAEEEESSSSRNNSGNSTSASNNNSNSHTPTTRSSQNNERRSSSSSSSHNIHITRSLPPTTVNRVLRRQSCSTTASPVDHAPRATTTNNNKNNTNNTNNNNDNNNSHHEDDSNNNDTSNDHNHSSGEFNEIAQIQAFVKSESFWRYNENSLFSLLFQAPTCFLYTSSQVLIHQSVMVAMCFYLAFTVYDSFVSRALLVPDNSPLYLVMLVLFTVMLILEWLGVRERYGRGAVNQPIVENVGDNSSRVTSSDDNLEATRTKRLCTRRSMVVWSVNSLLFFSYLMPYIALVFGGVKTIDSMSVLQLVKWLLVPLVFSGILITRLIAIIAIYLIHMGFILMLPSFSPSFVQLNHVSMILGCVLPVKMCILFFYYFMVNQQKRLQSQMKHCFDMMMVTTEAIVIHKDGKILDVNPAFQRLFGYSITDCKHIDLRDLFVEAPFDCLMGHQDIAKLTNETSSDINNNIPRKVIFECIGRTKQGKHLALEIISKIQSCMGEDVYVLGIRSIESRQEKETVLEDVAEMKAKSRFLSIVSHELKTPINAIQLLSEMIHDDCDEIDDMRDNAKIIQKSARHLLIVISDILDYSKLEMGTLTLNPEVFDLPQSIEDVIDVVAQKAYEKSLDIAVYIPKTLPRRLIGDSNRFQQIVSNLVSNAVKFTDHGQIIVNVDLESENEDEIVVSVKVIDSGIGISKDDQKKLFKMFSQVDNSAKRRYEGTGVGLAICKQLVSIMDGDIGVKSRVGEGSKFWFTVTLKKPSIDTSPQVEPLKVDDEVTSSCNIYGPKEEEPETEAVDGQHNKDVSNTFNYGEFSCSYENDTQYQAIHERRRSRNAVFVDVNGDDKQNMVILNDSGENQVYTVNVRSDVNSASSTTTPFFSQVSDGVFDGDDSHAGSTQNRGQTLLIIDNFEVATVMCKYMSDFNEKYLLASSISEVLDNQSTYIVDPIEEIIIDEGCLVFDGDEDIVALIRRVRKTITASNKRLSCSPSTPLMVLTLFLKGGVFEDVLLQFKLCIRKPIYLSLIEKLFYNDLVVHRKYPVYEDSFEEDDEAEQYESETPTSGESSRSGMIHDFDHPEEVRLRCRASSQPHIETSSKNRIYVSFEIRPMRRFSSFSRRLSFPVTNTPQTQHVQEHKNRRRSMVPEMLKSKEINRFNSPRNTRLSLFTKLMLKERSGTPAQYIYTVIDKFQRLHSTPRLLMVEDQPINQKVTKRIIEALGVEVEIAGNGIEALSLLNIPIHEARRESIQDTRLFEYDIILMDGNMPELDGLETSRHIREVEAQMFARIGNTQPYRIPIIGLTASSEEFFQQRCLESGMDEVLTKPIKRQALETMLQKYLQESDEWKQLKLSQSLSPVVASGSAQEQAYKQIAGYRITSK